MSTFRKVEPGKHQAMHCFTHSQTQQTAPKHIDSSREQMCTCCLLQTGTDGTTDTRAPQNSEQPSVKHCRQTHRPFHTPCTTPHGGCVNVSNQCNAHACCAGSVNLQCQQGHQPNMSTPFPWGKHGG